MIPPDPLLLFFVEGIIPRSKSNWTPHSIRVALFPNAIVKLRSFLLAIRESAARSAATAADCFSDCLIYITCLDIRNEIGYFATMPKLPGKLAL